MSLSLQIENVEQLSDGGPVAMQIDKRGLDIGRDPFMDWTLPDPDRFISGKHCEIHFRDGGYWLHDVSTNGTSINAPGGRLTEPHQLTTGDRIFIGGYIVGVTLTDANAAAAQTTPDPRQSAGSGGGDPWGVADSAEAVDRNAFNRQSAPPGSGARPVQGDLSEEHIEWGVGNVSGGGSDPSELDWGQPAGGGGGPGGSFGWDPAPAAGGAGGASGGWDTGSDDPWGGAPASTPKTEPEESAEEPVNWAPASEPKPTPDAGGEAPAWAPEAAEEPADEGGASTDWKTDPAAPATSAAPASDAAAPPKEPVASASLPEPQPSSKVAEEEEPLVLSTQAAAQSEPQPTPKPLTVPEGAEGSSGDFVAAFERGAGMPAGSVSGRSGEQLAEELGQLFRSTAQNLQAMLAARAETKSAMRSSERTMIGAMENNPLKFSPSPEDAMRIMFGEKTRSYLDARQTLDASFGDLQRHQMQTFAAMQQALAALIEDLAPETIAGATAKDGGLASLVSSRRAKLWDTYVERFNSKAARHERGMIDAFMILFSEMYDRQG